MTGLPSNNTWPAEGAIRPAIHVKSVDLPHPDGPTTVTNSPLRTANDTSARAAVIRPLLDSYSLRRLEIVSKLYPTYYKSPRILARTRNLHDRGLVDTIKGPIGICGGSPGQPLFL